MSSEGSVHFIVLIDDSGDMTGGNKTAILNSLPSLLFKGSVGGREVNPALPRFNPSRDHISIVYFTIVKTPGGGCRPDQEGMSARPEDIFTLEDDWGIKNQGEFSSRLGGSLRQPCRSHTSAEKGPGELSPILTAPTLILPYLQDRLPPDSWYSKTILIVATNGEYNTTKSPAEELRRFEDRNVQGTDVARQLAYKVSRLFSLDTPPAWLISLPDGRTNFFVSEVKPARDPDMTLSYQPSIKLDRQATSPERLRLAPEVAQAGDLRILTKGDNPPYTYDPLYIRMRFHGPQGEAWQVGGNTLSDDFLNDLRDCRPPACTRDESTVTVSLFGALGDRLSIGADEQPPGEGQLEFAVGMRYLTGVYDHLQVESSERRINIQPARIRTLPGYLFLPDVTLDNRELARQYVRDDDGVTTQEEAQDRILRAHNRYNILLVVLVVLAVVVAILYLYRTKFHRRFRPRLEWHPSPEVVVDFNRPGASRLLAGVLRVSNVEDVPWLGRLVGNETQPTRKALLSLTCDFSEHRDLEVTGQKPVGFIAAHSDDAHAAQGGDGLNLQAEEIVSDGTQMYIFLAADAIRDYNPAGHAETAAGHTFNVKLLAKMSWRSHDGASDSLFHRLKSWWVMSEAGERMREMSFPLTVKPEEPRKPRVKFLPAIEQRLNFVPGRDVPVGRFQFRSQAEHHFALPFVGGKYTVQSYRNGRPLGGEPISLKPREVVVPPRKTVEVPANLCCDGETIANPDPVSDVYTFSLNGDFDAASKAGPHAATLYRDPTVAEVELMLDYPEPKREFFWAKDDRPRQRVLLPDGSGVDEVDLGLGDVELEAHNIEFESGSGVTPELLSLVIGNSGRVNRARVAVNITTKIFCAAGVEVDIRLELGRTYDDLLAVYDGEEMNARVEVAEGEPPQRRSVRVHPGIITKITSAVIPAEKLWARISLDLVLTDDNKREARRSLTFRVPLGLEQLPGLNWLCIDFGTSAIAAALGTGQEGGIATIRLQELKPPGGQSYVEADSLNSEHRDHNLLPSLVICDADLRRSEKPDAPSRPGFPSYYHPNLSLTPGAPDFVGLPATSTQIRNNADRVIYSLKSWLARAPRTITLRTAIPYEDNGHQVTRESLPLDKVIESGFAALAEGYLLVNPQYRADRIVLTYPNTFTRRHVESLHDIAFRALSPRFGIPLPERVHLISESDAVAYYHCMKQMRDRPRGGTELILVYDFGAGTLDLSLIRVDWQKEPNCYPIDWTIEGRIGVPVAGNYFDELLARLIDELLDSEGLTGREFIEYQYPLVRKKHNSQPSPDYRAAVMNLWQEIRTAKHAWDGASPLDVRVGSEGSATEAVKLKMDENRLTDKSRDALRAARQAAGSGVRLWSDGDSIFITIPAERVKSDKRIETFIDFVTDTVIDELSHATNVSLSDVDAVIVSGRGALWPGLREKVWGRFPGAEKPLLSEKEMKDAVVRGAIARQELSLEADGRDKPQWQPQLGVLINNEEDLVLECEWDKPIDLTRSPFFRLVQVNLADPDPRNDLKPGSLRRHFYIDLADQKFRSEVWARTKKLYIKKVEENGKQMLYLTDRDGHQRVPISTQARAAETATSLPWPIGPDYILEPEP